MAATGTGPPGLEPHKDTAFTLGSYSADPLCQSKVRALLTGLVKGVSGWRKQASERTEMSFQSECSWTAVYL